VGAAGWGRGARRSVRGTAAAALQVALVSGYQQAAGEEQGGSSASPAPQPLQPLQPLQPPPAPKPPIQPIHPPQPPRPT
jgi:hypothetical protein